MLLDLNSWKRVSSVVLSTSKQCEADWVDSWSFSLSWFNRPNDITLKVNVGLLAMLFKCDWSTGFCRLNYFLFNKGAVIKSGFSFEFDILLFKMFKVCLVGNESLPSTKITKSIPWQIPSCLLYRSHNPNLLFSLTIWYFCWIAFYWSAFSLVNLSFKSAKITFAIS